MNWIQEIFKQDKAIIGLCHLKALPSDPFYDEKGGLESVYEAALKDVLALQEGGIDGIQFTNEFSIPYNTEDPADPIIVAAMANIIGRLKPVLTVPFGANIIGDPYASIALCAATGAKWTRGSYHGTWATNEGLLNSSCAKIYRYRHNLHADDLKLVHYVIPESSKDIAGRDPVDSLKSHVFLNKPDALGLAGLVAGQKVDVPLLKSFKSVYPNEILFAVTGVNTENVREIMSIADAAFVGTSLKENAVFENPVSKENVQNLMKQFKSLL